ncbi:methyltransferase domain-containing protein [Azospirillum sp.]|uniref:methyltransferase domain-containing protein n=1 Tax=Azospirillum sp. TaxID=34012 RepID=UPI003D742D36
MRREHWCRVVMNRAVEAYVNKLDHPRLAALEISGRAWAHLPFKLHFPTGYPNYDVCKSALVYEDKGQKPFDIIFIEQVLEHVQSPAAAVRNIYNSLAEGGHLVLSTPFLLKIHDAPGDYWRWTEAGLRLLLQEAGFAAQDIETGSWGNRDCLMANLDDWAWYDPEQHSLRNEPELPLVVWAFARKFKRA